MVQNVFRADVLTAFSGIGFVLATIPLSWQMESWNVGGSLYGFWSAIACLIQFVNHLVWRNHARVVAPIWCEIGLRVLWMAHIGIVSAALVIARRVALISTGKAGAVYTRRDKLRMVLIDLALGLSFPFAQLIICEALFHIFETLPLIVGSDWFVQGHRFDIFEGVGCVTAIPNTILVLILSTGWPIPIGIISAYYSVCTIRAFFLRRKVFRQVLASNPNLTIHRYFRLLFMAALEISCTVPLCITVVCLNLTSRIYPYRGFEDLHLNFNRIRQYPFEIWTQWPDVVSSTLTQEWLLIGCALVYFLIFGLTEEARNHYINTFFAVSRFLRVLPRSDETSPKSVRNPLWSRILQRIGYKVPEKPKTTVFLSFASATVNYESDRVTGDDKAESFRHPSESKSKESLPPPYGDLETQRTQSLDLTDPDLVLDISSHSNHV